MSAVCGGEGVIKIGNSPNKEGKSMDLEDLIDKEKEVGHVVPGCLVSSSIREVLIMEDVWAEDAKGHLEHKGKRETGVRGYFHGWFQTGNVNDEVEVVAVVEMNDGQVELIYAGYIKFINKAESKKNPDPCVEVECYAQVKCNNVLRGCVQFGGPRKDCNTCVCIKCELSSKYIKSCNNYK